MTLPPCQHESAAAVGPYVDLFAGPGGWDTGVRDLGVVPLGFEWDIEAVHTAQAAGHHRAGPFWTDDKGREHGPDIATLDPSDYAVSRQGTGIRGLIASPPCQGFSTAGKGRSRDDSEHLLKALKDVRTRTDIEAIIRDLTPTMTDARTLLVLEPLRWALALTPSWLAWEQVPGVLPLWEACADILRRVGYSVATGVLSAEQYGVPQTRRRAILVARAPWFTRTHGPATLPTPTHSRYYSRDPQRLDPGVLPWVSMAGALGRGMTARPSMTVTGGGTGAGGAEPFGHGARDGMVRELEAGRWVQRSNYSTGSSDGSTAAERGRTERDLDLPSTTVTSKGFQWRPSGLEDADEVRLRGNQKPVGSTQVDHEGYIVRDEDRPAMTVSGEGASYAWQPSEVVEGGDPTGIERRPSTTIVGSYRPEIVAAPGYRKAGDPPRQRTPGSVRVTVEEAAVLQSFPADYPWQGKSGARYRQVGDAVPPLLARAIVAHVAAIPTEPPPPRG